MEKVNQILNHPIYRQHLKAIEEYEKDRIFCRHDLQHFLDVARIGYIYILEAGLDVTKEEVYAFGLLHDIGRALEYSQGIEHDSASVRLAGEILVDTGFAGSQVERIMGAIGHHRTKDMAESSGSFEGMMYKADKASRACYNCSAWSECYWASDKKNMKIEV